MRPIYIDIDLADVDDNGIFENQTLVGAGDLTLDGAEIVNGEWVTPDGFAKKIGIACAGDVNTVTFTITGYSDISKHNLITDTITGVNANTVESSKYFYYITSIAADAAVGTDVYGGSVDEAMTAALAPNWRNGVLSVSADVTGAVDATVQQTFSDIQNPDDLDFNWQNFPEADLVGFTTSQQDAYSGIPRAVRVVINSYSSGARIELTLQQTDF